MCNLHLPARSPTVSSPPSLRLKRKRDGEIDIENRRKLLSLRGVISPYLLVHGGVGLVHIGGHLRTPTKPHESGVYDSGKVGYLSCARGSYVPFSGGGICHGVHDILRARIWCAITLIPLLTTAVLWPGVASLDPLPTFAF
jgi:hypothetical protein